MPFSKGDPNINRLGRPKGQVLKEYAREYFALKTDTEKKAYLEKLEEKLPGFAWRMAEGNPQTDVTSGGEKIFPTPLDNVHQNESVQENKDDEKTD